MALLARIADGIYNAITGAGTQVDRRTATGYAVTTLTTQEVELAYSGLWLARKIVDLPAKDMTREGRDWQADKQQIEALEAEERRLKLWPKLRAALIAARLHGGGALFLGTDQAESGPLNVEGIKAGGLRYIHALSRHELSHGDKRRDVTDPWFGEPEYWQINVGGEAVGGQIHPSRMVTFIGQRRPLGATVASDSWYWGESVLQSIDDAVKNAETVQNALATLIDEAKVDVWRLPNFMANAASEEYEQQLSKRLTMATAGKSVHRALILDSEEEWEQRQLTLTGIPEVIEEYLSIVAGAADIPVTRLLGRSPKGLQSTGNGEERDYLAMVATNQNDMLAPALEQIDEVLIRSALGGRPPEVYYEFAPLDRPTAKELAEIEKLVADVVSTIAGTGLVPDEALSKAVVNRMVESGQWPGLDEAVDEVRNAMRLAPDANADPSDPSAIVDVPPNDPARVTDAEPRTLYVSRRVVNADEIIAWAKAQGFTVTQPAEALHVTIAFSRTPIDWMKVGEGWGGNGKGELEIAPGGPRVVEPLGPKGAVVLMFSSSELQWRHMAIREAGASWDWPEYQPHVTITYQPGDIDPATVEPYRGRIVLGPEVFEEVVEDWEKGVVEA